MHLHETCDETQRLLGHNSTIDRVNVNCLSVSIQCGFKAKYSMWYYTDVVNCIIFDITITDIINIYYTNPDNNVRTKSTVPIEWLNENPNGYIEHEDVYIINTYAPIKPTEINDKVLRIKTMYISEGIYIALCKIYYYQQYLKISY